MVTPMGGLFVSGGTRWLHKVRPCIEDASCVKQLRSCGAILVGKTNMHELGAGASGINPHYGATRNPYDINKISGGSSSGSAAAVCAGLCPVALGVDGGGSVRIPAALCGVVGFKPTSGRISNSGILPLNWTVGMPGILAATVEDALITNRQTYFHKEIFKMADVIVTPTTGVTAYPLLSDAADTGELDYINGAALVRFSIAGNFLGLPAVTLLFPEICWKEFTHWVLCWQTLCIKSYKRPKVYYDLLKKEQA
ncbi:hypothetical protein GW17_00043868 [Ensete ventricosum]|uniref:Uncharacterized protein n=1 Tax=Ensete ventricosum TaxID=4639 RepID=A0A444D6E6_ENSVE|nr:hypothetical protein B296_00011058 [Ensete ventricosum]RWV93667.1 hypothetical protein GW17_00043868 [Ensete ventricosum]